MIAGWDDADDRLLARAIFGTDDAGLVHRMIARWAAKHGFGAATVADIALSIGAAVTLTRAGDDTLFVKVWPGSVDVRGLAAQMAVQQAMHARGFPAPAVLSDPRPLGAGWAVAMAHDRSGEPTDARQPGVREAMAAGLARLIAEADGFRALADLPRRSLPSAAALWPPPHNALFDFAATRAGAEWIDGIAAQALAALRAGPGRLVVGHGDWSARNMRMRGGELAVVYEWDSVVLEREALILGTAAAHFPMSHERDGPETPSIEEVAAFVRDHEAARGIAFTRAERAEIAAGATYARAYKARCEHAIDPDGRDWRGSSRHGLRAHGRFRL